MCVSVCRCHVAVVSGRGIKWVRAPRCVRVCVCVCLSACDCLAATRSVLWATAAAGQCSVGAMGAMGAGRVGGRLAVAPGPPPLAAVCAAVACLPTLLPYFFFILYFYLFFSASWRRRARRLVRAGRCSGCSVAACGQRGQPLPARGWRASAGRLRLDHPAPRKARKGYGGWPPGWPGWGMRGCAALASPWTRVRGCLMLPEAGRQCRQCSAPGHPEGHPGGHHATQSP